MLRLMALLLLVLVACTPPLPAGDPAATAAPVVATEAVESHELARFTNSAALVVACGAYRSLPAITEAVLDAQAVRDALQAHGFAVTALPDPTASELDKALADFLLRWGQEPESRLVIYLCCRSAVRDGHGYLLSVDALKDVGDDQFLSHATAMEDFLARTRRARSRHILCVIDSSIKISFFTNQDAMPSLGLKAAGDSVRLVIASGNDQQVLPAVSVFRRAFVEGLAGGADADRDGYILGSELFNFIRARMVDSQAANPRAKEQTPQWRAYAQEDEVIGEFAFASPVMQSSAAIVVAPQPKWALVSGRDSCGQWADVQAGGVTQRMRWISPGTFTMGSPPGEAHRLDVESPHQVTLTRGFWLGDSACTQAMWQGVMGSNPAHFTGDPQRPVEQVSWEDVQLFMARFNGVVAGGGFGLPSEAQREFACRAGTTGPFAGPALDAIAWHKGNSGQQTHAVKQKTPNAWGLYDMHGNVWEWCADIYAPYPLAAVTDPTGPPSGSVRVFRGGSWHYEGWGCRSANRSWDKPEFRGFVLGFRLCVQTARQ
jgi:sulfatase modifying factor 1